MRAAHHTDEMVELRRPTPVDHAAVASVVNEWWGGRDLQALVQALFFEHFASTSLIETGADGVRCFLLAFDSADHPDVTYIHFVGVRPDLRGEQRGRLLYERTFADARDGGANECGASPA